MNLNPLALLDALLADWASPRVRRLIHTLLALVLVVVTAVLAAGGDWKVALGTLLAALYAAINKANTPGETVYLETGEDENLGTGPVS
jgi:hypothetical protein